MFCKNCGTKIPEGFRFCPNCGIKIIGEIPVQGGKVSQKGSTRYLALIGGLLILFVFLLAGIWIGRRPDKTTEKNRENSSYLFDTNGIRKGMRRRLQRSQQHWKKSLFPLPVHGNVGKVR